MFLNFPPFPSLKALPSALTGFLPRRINTMTHKNGKVIKSIISMSHKNGKVIALRGIDE